MPFLRGLAAVAISFPSLFTLTHFHNSAQGGQAFTRIKNKAFQGKLPSSIGFKNISDFLLASPHW
jgi:hypothetical protein